MNELMRKIRRRWRRLWWRAACLTDPARVKTFSLIDPDIQIQYPVKTAIGWELFAGEFETFELAFVKHSLRPGDVFVDIGANAGIFAVTAARKVGSNGRVYAFEPGDREHQLLRGNVALNHLDNAALFTMAVSNTSGTAQFAISRDGAMNSLRKTNHPGQVIQQWQTVETITLDEFVARNHVPKIDFIKIDVEGAEKLVFEGAQKVLSSHRPLTVLFEAADVNSDNFGYTTRAFLDQVKGYGAELSRFSADGTVVPVEHFESHFGKETYNFVAKFL
jgi:FkbM family methyltransferase